MRTILAGLAVVGLALCSAVASTVRAAEPSPELIAYGKTLVEAGDCAGCHTADPAKPFAGGKRIDTPFGAIYAPHLTPDRDTGIGGWTEEQIADYLESGNRPDGDVAGGLMAEVIQGSSAGFKDLTKADRLAIAKYLKSIPAVKNKID